MSVSRRLALGLFLVVLTALALGRVVRNDFVVYDDETYVTGNPHVKAGLTAESVAWAVTTGHGANWHPLTWLSHMLDWETFGASPWGHHLTSLLLHVATTLLLFLLLDLATGATARSALVAALFAVHPLHVESVAWVAERKDVLSALLWVAATLAYVSYARSPSGRRLGLVVVLFALGLLAKPMLVTLPFTLLLLDRWPLGRWPAYGDIAALRPLLREKLPLFALSAVSCVVTVGAQRAGRALQGFDEFPLSARIANAIVSYVEYLVATFLPLDLAVFYPHPRAGLPAWHVVAAAAVLILVTAVAVVTRRKRPYLLVGWLFYLGTLVPVSGLVQVGLQARADRYTYIPLVGVFVMIAWGLGDLLALLARRTGIDPERAFLAVSASIVLPLAAAACVQAGYWKDSTTLLTHALAAAPPSPVVLTDLGVVLERSGGAQEAVHRYEEALRIDPAFYDAHENLARIAAASGRLDEAAGHFEACLRKRPDDPDLNGDLAIVRLRQGRVEDATRHFAEAVRVAPSRTDLRIQLTGALLRIGRTADAIREIETAVSREPESAPARYTLAVAASAAGDYERAWRELGAARRLGFTPPEAFVAMLRARMPEPRDEP